ncbi:MAG TPA: GAF domain-containing protein, partial [Dehalococcoidia bacterium]|nr:GAF domain-containing protein [Dehalococcoidia bacterium]
DEHRADLSARAIRLESNLELPDLGDHFESRLVLLSRRLADCCDFMRLRSDGPGRFRLLIEREITLLEVPK